MKIIVAGAGIAGLAFAAVMQQVAPDAELVVLERRDSPADGGYSVSLAVNGAVPVLQGLAIHDGLAPKLATIESLVLLDPSGRALFRPDSSGKARPLVQRIERRALQSALLRTAKTSVRFGASVRGYVQTGDAVHVGLSSGATEAADWLIAADGADSAIRHQMIGDRKIYRGLSAIVGDASSLAGHPLLAGGSFMTLGHQGHSVLVYRQVDGTHLRFTERFSEPGTFSNPEVMLRRLKLGTAGWHAPIPEIVAALDPASLIFRDYYDRDPVPRIRDGRVWLIGDAAHPMVPFREQGANLAILDAKDLARLLGGPMSDTDSVANTMMRRGAQATEASRQAAARLHPASRFRRIMRNSSFRVASLWSSAFAGRSKG